MSKEQSVVKFYKDAQGIFWDRHQKYGTKGMDVKRAIALARTKLDRIENGEIDDSCIDLANYALIVYLISHGLWEIGQKITEATKQSQLLVKKLHADGGVLAPQKEGDCGYDLVVAEDTVVPPLGNFPVSVPCGFGMKLPMGYWAEIRPRSSTSSKLGILVHQSCMDEGYTGPWFVVCNSLLTSSVKIEKGTRIAQCVIHKTHLFLIEETGALPETERGMTGFGSSGLKV